jgi:hypothetical protein
MINNIELQTGVPSCFQLFATDGQIATVQLDGTTFTFEKLDDLVETHDGMKITIITDELLYRWENADFTWESADFIWEANPDGYTTAITYEGEPNACITETYNITIQSGAEQRDVLVEFFPLNGHLSGVCFTKLALLDPSNHIHESGTNFVMESDDNKVHEDV